MTDLVQYALFKDGVFAETRWFREPPFAQPKAGWRWYPVGAKVVGEPAGWEIVNGAAIQTVLPPPSPSTDPVDYPLTRVQFFAMLEILGSQMVPPRDLDADIQAAIEAIPDITQRAVARAKYKEEPTFYRNNLLLAQIASSPPVNLAGSVIDPAWMQAKDIA